MLDNHIDISIIVPGIRVEKWLSLYNSVRYGTNKSFEFIFCGPTPPSSEIFRLPNVKFIQDFGSPNRSQQIAATKATGKYITWHSDDSLIMKDVLDTAYNILEQIDCRDAISFKFLESDSPLENMYDDHYYLMSPSMWTSAPFINDDQFILNVGFMRTDLFFDLGGFDAVNFECTAMSHSDLAVRITNYGGKIHLIDMIGVKCGFDEGNSGVHGPVFDAHHYFDIPTFKGIYCAPSSKNRHVIDLDNWKKSPDVWHRRNFN